MIYDMKDSDSTVVLLEFEGLPSSTLLKKRKRFSDVRITSAALVVWIRFC